MVRSAVRPHCTCINNPEEWAAVFWESRRVSFFTNHAREAGNHTELFGGMAKGESWNVRFISCVRHVIALFISVLVRIRIRIISIDFAKQIVVCGWDDSQALSVISFVRVTCYRITDQCYSGGQPFNKLEFLYGFHSSSIKYRSRMQCDSLNAHHSLVRNSSTQWSRKTAHLIQYKICGSRIRRSSQ